MAERCEFCGAVNNDPRHRFCSRSCAARANMGVKYVEVDTDFPWKEIVRGIWQCRYNEGVCCHDRDCAQCGWNPAVAEERLGKISSCVEDVENGK